MQDRGNKFPAETDGHGRQRLASAGRTSGPNHALTRCIPFDPLPRCVATSRVLSSRVAALRTMHDRAQNEFADGGAFYRTGARDE